MQSLYITGSSTLCIHDTATNTVYSTSRPTLSSNIIHTGKPLFKATPERVQSLIQQGTFQPYCPSTSK